VWDGTGPRACIGPDGGGRLDRFVAQITEFPCLLVLGVTRPDHQPTQPTNAIHPIPLGQQSNGQKPWAVNPETEDDVDKSRCT
jgi:hypothetical protein